MIELLTAVTKSLAWRVLRMCGLVLCCQAKFAISSMKSWVAYVIRGMASAETILGRESHESCFMIRLIRASGSSSQRRTLFLVNVNNFSAKKFVILSFICEHEGRGKERQTRADKGETKSVTLLTGGTLAPRHAKAHQFYFVLASSVSARCENI